MSLTKRLAKALQFLASYTYARSIDNGSGQDNFDTFSILGNQLDNRANRGASDFDRTHRFVLSYLWDLPRPALAAKSTAGRLLISNWQVAGIITAMSGLPIDIVDSNAGSFYLGPNNGLSRPSRSPGRYSLHCNQQHSGRLLLQPVCVCPTGGPPRSDYSKFRRNGCCWSCGAWKSIRN